MTSNQIPNQQISQISAMEAAKFLLSLDPNREYFIKKEMADIAGISIPMIGNFRLNKILHIAQMLYASKYGHYLFLEKISRPFLITQIKKIKELDKELFFLRLLSITSQEEEEITEKQKPFVSQIQIRQLPDCLRIDPSFVRIHRPFELKIIPKRLVEYLCKKCPVGCFKLKEYDYLVEKHEKYRNNKMNELLLLPPFKVEILE
ncbi:15768_t:CDS:2, partial [Racocetra persica]